MKLFFFAWNRVAESIPIVVVGNKTDLNKKIKVSKFSTQHGFQEYHLSVKQRSGLEKPFFYLAKKLFG